MLHNFFEVSINSYSIDVIFGEVLGHSSQRKITGLNQSFLKAQVELAMGCKVGLAKVGRPKEIWGQYIY